MKKLLKVILVLVLLVVIGVVVLFMYVDTLARKAVEAGGTMALGVPTTLDKADVGVMSGTFSMSGLNVANPPGFSSPTFLKLNQGDVALNISSLTQETIELPLLTLSGVEVNINKKGTDTNYKVIIENLKKFETGGQPKAEGGKKFVIRKIEIKDVMVNAELIPLGGDAKQVNVPIDLITLTDVGAGGAGANMGDLANTLVKAILRATIENGGGILPADIAGDLTSGLGSLGDIGGKMGEGVGKAIGDIGAGAGEAGKEADKTLKGLGGLLGGDKDKKKDN